MPAVLDYPHAAISLLGSDRNSRLAARETHEKDFWRLGYFEKAVREGNLDVALVLKDVLWKDIRF